ncbi:MAG: non-ribosomal peptide synthetase, partial [bacterium]|nr:non-ribosomal peptide synthetase [bacterium]
NKQEIIEFLANLQKQEQFKTIEPAAEQQYYAVSSAQERLYVLQQVEPDSTGYNMPFVLQLGENVIVEELEGVLRKLIDRHESLRTSFEIVGEKPVQKVHNETNFALENYQTPESGIPEQITRFTRPFELNRAPLLRAGVLTVSGTNRRLILLDMHHIITDGMSQAILGKEFNALYAGEELPPLKLQYKDYSQWQNSREVREMLARQQDYWLQTFAGETQPLNLPTDYPRPPMQRFEGE